MLKRICSNLKLGDSDIDLFEVSLDRVLRLKKTIFVLVEGAKGFIRFECDDPII